MSKDIIGMRVEGFEKKHKETLENSGCVIVPFNGIKITIDTQSDEFGIVDYFVKANKILIRKDNKWEEHGLRWIENNLM